MHVERTSWSLPDQSELAELEGSDVPPSEADDLLRRAFPYGATVHLELGGEFLSLRYKGGRGTRPDSLGVYFVRDPGDTSADVSPLELERAAVTGRLSMPTGRVRRPEAGDCRMLAFPFDAFVGPQSSDPHKPDSDRFRARLRLHQSWWRTFRLRVPFGTGPTRSSTSPFGNMLLAEDGADGLNFVSPEAHLSFRGALATGRTGVKAWDTANNLLTSQAMCFNVFGHLRHHPDLAAAFFAEVLAEPHTAEVQGIEIEHHSDAIPDKTAFDAYTFRSGAGDVAIETKLTEPFSQTEYHWRCYTRTCAAASGRWLTDDPARLGDLRWSQLWRNHLLAVEGHLRRIGHDCGNQWAGRCRDSQEVCGNRTGGCRDPRRGGGPEWPRVMVVHHPLDTKCIDAVRGYRSLLADPVDVVCVDLRTVVDTLRRLVGDDPAQRGWLDRLDERYLRLDLSEALVELATPS